MISYLGLFLYGLTTFISPCSLGLVSAYLTYTLKDAPDKSRGLSIGVCYISAMSLVFFFLGFALSSLIPVNLASSKLFYLLAGMLMIIIGVNTLGVLDSFEPLSLITGHISDVSNELRTNLMSLVGGKSDHLSTFMFGVVISIALGPCSLALVLPAVMMTIFNAPSALHGGFQLLAFGVGHSLPVLFLSLLLAQSRYIFTKRMINYGNIMKYILGLGLVLLGVWMIIEAI